MDEERLGLKYFFLTTAGKERVNKVNKINTSIMIKRERKNNTTFEAGLEEDHRVSTCVS